MLIFPAYNNFDIAHINSFSKLFDQLRFLIKIKLNRALNAISFI